MSKTLKSVKVGQGQISVIVKRILYTLVTATMNNPTNFNYFTILQH